MQQQQQLQPTQQLAVASPAKSTSGWTEHKSPAGVPYFYNSVTGVSTYERPVELGGAVSAASPATASSATTAPSNQSTHNNPKQAKWQTYTDESTGKKYYSDGVTTTWTRPPDLPPESSEGNKTTPTKSNKRTSDADMTSTKKRKKVDKSDSISLYANKAEAIAAFKGLLLAKDIAPTTKWNDVQRICSDDIRWNACTTAGERKQALAEYQTKRANELRDVKRQEKVRAKEAYTRLLTEVLTSNKSFTPGTSRFMDVRDLLSKENAFHAVEDETTREELFYEWVEEMQKKEERLKRNKKRDAKENFVKYLRGMEEEGRLTFASTW